MLIFICILAYLFIGIAITAFLWQWLSSDETFDTEALFFSMVIAFLWPLLIALLVLLLIGWIPIKAGRALAKKYEEPLKKFEEVLEEKFE